MRIKILKSYTLENNFHISLITQPKLIFKFSTDIKLMVALN